MPAPIQYKPLGEAEACDTRNLPSPTSPNSAYPSPKRGCAMIILILLERFLCVYVGTGWSSEPQSFLSSEPSSPAPTSTGECSMSISLISNDG